MNTVGPVPVASGYGSRTLTHSAAHMLVDNKENPSSLLSKAISPKMDRIPVVESRDSGIQITTFTGSNLHLAKEGVLQRPKAFNSMPKLTCFTRGSLVNLASGLDPHHVPHLLYTYCTLVPLISIHHHPTICLNYT